MTLDHLSARQREALSVLDQFTVEQWCIWIRSLLDEVDCEPDLEIGHTPPHRVLIWLFEKGLTNIACFVSALGNVYDNSTPARPAQLFYLLQAISVVRPEVCRDRLLQQLKSRRLIGVVFKGFDLNALALTVRSSYTVHDDQFLDFVERSARDLSGFSYRLAAFRAWARRDVVKALDLIELLLPFIADENERKIFGNVLRAIAWSESWRPFYEWFVSDRRRILEKKSPDYFCHLVSALRAWAVPWRPSELAQDPFGVLLSVHIHAGSWPFVAEELFFVGKMVDHWSLRERPEDVSRALLAIWDSTEQQIRKWGEPPPWGIGVTLPWVILEERPRLLRTELRPEVIQREERQMFSQEVALGESERIFKTFLRGSRAAYIPESRSTVESRQIEEHFVGMKETASIK